MPLHIYTKSSLNLHVHQRLIILPTIPSYLHRSLIVIKVLSQMILPCPDFSCPRWLAEACNCHKALAERAVFPLSAVDLRVNYGKRRSLLQCYRVRLRNVYIHRANTHTNISAFSWSISVLNVCERIEIKEINLMQISQRVVWQGYIYWNDRLFIIKR